MMLGLQESPVQNDELAAGKDKVAASDYATLLAAFQTASAKMKASSAAFNAVLISLPAGLSDEDRTSRIASAATTHEEAREAFLSIASQLHGTMIRQIVASHPVIRTSAQHG